MSNKAIYSKTCNYSATGICKMCSKKHDLTLNQADSNQSEDLSISMAMNLMDIICRAIDKSAINENDLHKAKLIWTHRHCCNLVGLPIESLMNGIPDI